MNYSKAVKFNLSLYAGIILLVFYFPIICIIIASLSKKRYFSFPFPWHELSLAWYGAALNSQQIKEYFLISVKIASLSTILSLIIGFFGALAYARYNWPLRKSFQKIVLLPLFFPQTVLGLSLLLWYNFLNITPSWQTAILAHTVWIAPIATLIISIQAFSQDDSLEEAARDFGASRWQILRWITFPSLLPGLISAACFCILLSWGNFALSIFTTGADTSLPEWLYARMSSAYQPIVPAVGSLSVLAALSLVLIFLIFTHFKSRKTQTSN